MSRLFDLALSITAGALAWFVVGVAHVAAIFFGLIFFVCMSFEGSRIERAELVEDRISKIIGR